MITRIKASNYRGLRSVDQPIAPFQILVGPNASGKSNFLDAFAFLGTLVSEGLETAIDERTENFHDLVWGREGNWFSLSIEARIPERWQVPIGEGLSQTIAYGVEVRIDPAVDAVIIAKETVALRGNTSHPEVMVVCRHSKFVEFKAERGDGEYRFELHRNDTGLRNLPDDESKFPAAVWLKNLLREGIQTVSLDNELLRGASPPYQGKPKVLNGFNLARLVAQLSDDSSQPFKDWLAHIRTALPDLQNVHTVLRPEDKYRYLMLHYEDGVEIPSWAVSDGSLHLLALTILAYLPDFRGIYLVEEPENGVHPQALETIFQSLSSVYEGQVLVTTHSPIMLSLAKVDQILCFQKTPNGTKIVNGAEHPILMEWKGEISLGDLFASGVLT